MSASSAPPQCPSACPALGWARADTARPAHGRSTDGESCRRRAGGASARSLSRHRHVEKGHGLSVWRWPGSILNKSLPRFCPAISNGGSPRQTQPSRRTGSPLFFFLAKPQLKADRRLKRRCQPDRAELRCLCGSAPDPLVDVAALGDQWSVSQQFQHLRVFP